MDITEVVNTMVVYNWAKTRGFISNSFVFEKKCLGYVSPVCPISYIEL